MSLMEQKAYEEVIRYRVYPNGLRLILPNEVDIAIQSADFAGLEAAFEQFEAESEPRELREDLQLVKAFREKGHDTRPDREVYQDSLARVREWERERLARRQGFERAIAASRHRLARLQDPPPDDGADEEEEVYLLRPFSYRERIDADHTHTALNPETNQPELDAPARALALLKLVLLGRKYEKQVVKIEDPAADLEDQTLLTLLARMWNRNAMSADLAGFFRGGRAAAGNEGPAGAGRTP